MVKEDTVKNKKTDDLFSAATDQAIISSDIFRPKESFKSLVLDKSKASNALLTELSSGPTKQVTFVLDKSESKELSASTPEPLDKDEKSKLELQGEQQNSSKVKIKILMLTVKGIDVTFASGIEKEITP